MKLLLTVGLALSSCAIMADVNQNFNDASGLPEGWTAAEGSSATVEAVESGATLPSGNVLSVEGTVTCENTGTASEWSQTSFLVQAPEDENTDFITGEEVSGCQIAVTTGAADGENLKVMVYRGATGDETAPSWIDSGKTVGKGAWFSVGLNFDYTVDKVQVVINEADAGWYPLVSAKGTAAGTPKKASVGSLAFVGSSKVDDVRITGADVVPATVLPEVLEGYTVKLSEIGVSGEQLLSTDTVGASNMTVAEKVAAGLDPTDDSMFVATALAPATEAGKLVVSVPCAFDNGQAYEVYVNGEKVDSTKAVVTDGSGKITGVNLAFEPGSAKVLKVQVKAVKPSAN